MGSPCLAFMLRYRLFMGNNQVS